MNNHLKCRLNPPSKACAKTKKQQCGCINKFVCNSFWRTVCSYSAAQQTRNGISAGRFRPTVHSYGPSTAAYIKRRETRNTGTECYDAEDVKTELLAVNMGIDLPTYFDLYFMVKNICLKSCLSGCAVFFWQCCRWMERLYKSNLYLRQLPPQVSLTATRIFF